VWAWQATGTSNEHGNESVPPGDMTGAVDGPVDGPPGDPAEVPLDGDAARPAKRAGRRRGGRTAGLIAVSLLVLIVVAAAVATFISVPYYALTPGQAENVSTLISLPASKVHAHPGGIYLTDVELIAMRAIEYPYFEYVDNQASVIQSDEIVGIIPVAEYDTDGVIDMSDATQSATYVALRDLGYKVDAIPVGAQLYTIDPLADTYSKLQVGDVVTAIDGTPTSQVAAVTPLIWKHKPGQTIAVTYRPDTSPLSGLPATVDITLGEYRIQADNARCYAVGEGTKYPLFVAKGYPDPDPCLGVEVQTYYRLADLPFPVTIDPEGIVGPSAGLAFTLGLINDLDPYSLTAGQKVAATGTMSLNGAVGDVGGVPQKTVAVENAGATVFFVPPQEYATAKAHSNGKLKIIAVTNVSQAIAYLVKMGGRLPSNVGS
jgi:Lon-like protease